jgi:capsular polysaccharide biosynthesis protein
MASWSVTSAFSTTAGSGTWYRPARTAFFGSDILYRIKGTVCSILSGGGAASGNYYHWLIDSLPRLHLVEKAGLLAQTDYVLVYDKTKVFVVDTLGRLGFGPERILDVRDHPHLQADQLLATSSVRGVLTHTPQWACDFLRRVLLPAPATSRTFSPLVYISRRDAPGRHVRNEEALEALLAEYGFETHTLSPYSQAEKIALFAQAQVIVSPVGAGLANLVFCAPGTHLIELLPKSFVVPDFLELSSRLEMHHHFLVCPDQHMSTTRSNAQRDHLTVDLAALRRLVERALQPVPATV